MVYKEEWNRILLENNNNIPFIELEWIINWWSYLGYNKELFVLVVKKLDTVYGFCPLMIEKKRMYNEIKFIGDPESSYMDFIINDKYKNEVIDTMLSYLTELEGNNLFNLTGLFEDSANYIYLKKYLEDRHIKYFSKSLISFYINLKENDYNSHFNSRYSSRSRQKFRRRERRLKDLGKLTYGEIDSKDLNKIFHIHEKRWEKRYDTSRFLDERTKAFFIKIASDINSRLEVKVKGLRLGEKIIGFLYDIECNGRNTGYRVSHDNDFNRYGIGKLILQYRIKEVFEKNLEIYDFGAGYEPYKSEWTDDYVNIYRFIFSTKGLSSRIVYMKYKQKEKFRALLKKKRRIVDIRRNTFGKVLFALSKENLVDYKNRFIGSIKKDGPINLLLKALKSLSEYIYKKESYTVLRLDGKPNLDINEDLSKDITTRQATIDDLDGLALALNIDNKEVIDRFHKKHKCFITLQNKKIIHCSWLDFTYMRIPQINYEFELENDQPCIYCYKFIDEKFPLKEVNNLIIYHILEYVKTNNCTSCYITLRTKDKHIIYMLRGIGFKLSASISGTKALNRIRTYSKQAK